MVQFTAHCGLVVVAAVLGTTGVNHLQHHRRLVAVVGDHNVFEPARARTVALALTASELAVAVVSVVALARNEPRLAMVAFAVAVVAGVSFVAYLRRLLRAGHHGSCGCTPLDSALTPASFAPAIALTTAALAGSAATLTGGFDEGGAVAWSGLPVLCGLVLAFLVVLLPATAPQVRSSSATGAMP